MNLRIATLQRLVILGVIGLAIVYFALLRPLARRVVEEAAPLQDLREELAAATIQAGLSRSTDFLALRTHLQSVRRAHEGFLKAEEQALTRMEHPPEVRARLEGPFQYVEFLNESQRRIEELTANAQSNRVTLTPGLARGFPRYQPELAQPELLWVQLATVNRLVRTAIRAGVREVNELSVEPLPTVEPVPMGPVAAPAAPAFETPTNVWSLLRVHLTVQGDMDAIGRMLVALALTPEELQGKGLPEELAGRPALFIEKVLLRRHHLEAANQARLEVVVGTAVARSSLPWASP